MRRLLLTLLLPLALAACGDEEEPAGTTASTTTATAETTERTGGDTPDADGDDRPADSEPAEQLERPLEVEDVLVAVLTDSGSPEQACGELVTDAFLRDAYGGRANCLAAREQGGVARELEVREVTESGSSAGAIAVPRGGPYDGVEVEVELVADAELGRGWLVNSLFADVPAGP